MYWIDAATPTKWVPYLKAGVESWQSAFEAAGFRDLERKLGDFQASDNEVRSHASLKGHTPSTFVGGHMVARAELNNVRWVSHCRRLLSCTVCETSHAVSFQVPKRQQPRTTLAQ